MVGWPCGGPEIPDSNSSAMAEDSGKWMQGATGKEVARSSREWQNALLPISQRLELLRERSRSQSKIVREEFVHYVLEWDGSAFDQREIEGEIVVFSQVVLTLIEWPGFQSGLAGSLMKRVLDPYEAIELRVASIRLMLSWNTRLKNVQANAEEDRLQIQEEQQLVCGTLVCCLEGQNEMLQGAALSGLLIHSKLVDSSKFTRFNHALLSILNDSAASESIKALALSVAQDWSLNQLAPVAEALAVNEDTSLRVRAASLGVLNGKDRDRVISQLAQQDR